MEKRLATRIITTDLPLLLNVIRQMKADMERLISRITPHPKSSNRPMLHLPTPHTPLCARNGANKLRVTVLGGG